MTFIPIALSLAGVGALGLILGLLIRNGSTYLIGLLALAVGVAVFLGQATFWLDLSVGLRTLVILRMLMLALAGGGGLLAVLLPGQRAHSALQRRQYWSREMQATENLGTVASVLWVFTLSFLIHQDLWGLRSSVVIEATRGRDQFFFTFAFSVPLALAISRLAVSDAKWLGVLFGIVAPIVLLVVGGKIVF
jgi:hypothetical protein